MPTPDTQDTQAQAQALGGSSAAKAAADPGPVNASPKAAKVLGVQFDPPSGPANKAKAGHHSARRPKPTQPRSRVPDLEAAHPRKDANSSGATDPDQSGGRTEKILRRLLSRRRNVVICLLFLLSVVVAVSVVSGFQGKGGAEGSATQSSKQSPQAPSSKSSIVSVNSQAKAYVVSLSTDTSVDLSQGGVDGGQSTSVSSEGQADYQGTAPTSTPS